MIILHVAKQRKFILSKLKSNSYITTGDNSVIIKFHFAHRILCLALLSYIVCSCSFRAIYACFSLLASNCVFCAISDFSDRSSLYVKRFSVLISTCGAVLLVIRSRILPFNERILVIVL